MVKVKKCSFCSYDVPIGRGITYVKKDGTIYNFCTKKCKKALLNYKKNPRKTRWTGVYGKE
ncbi:MAG: ribosomal protein L24e family protein [Candidatus Lokiarchaeota archaeon]|nr:ribosomal protein L24e family protein [Candidatus Lokiarchaeota archaeon]